MKTTSSKLTKKYQATVPEAVRIALHLKAGDSIAFDIDEDVIKVRKAHSIDLEFAAATSDTLTEWYSENDEEAFGDL